MEHTPYIPLSQYKKHYIRSSKFWRGVGEKKAGPHPPLWSRGFSNRAIPHFRELRD